MNPFTFQKRYFFISVVIFSIELYIVTFIKDSFIRPFIGDFLFVILLYCILKSFIKTPPVRLAFYVLLFAYGVEILQSFHLIDMLQLRSSRIAKILIGTTFSWGDMVAYTLGIGLTIFIEKYQIKKLAMATSKHRPPNV